jgi:hypothetical protein
VLFRIFKNVLRENTLPADILTMLKKLFCATCIPSDGEIETVYVASGFGVSRETRGRPRCGLMRRGESGTGGSRGLPGRIVIVSTVRIHYPFS